MSPVQKNGKMMIIAESFRAVGGASDLLYDFFQGVGGASSNPIYCIYFIEIDHVFIMPPISKKLTGHIGFGSCMRPFIKNRAC